MQQTIYTIGHSTHPQEKLLALLSMHSITALCDVRSAPFSRVNPQFNRETLKAALSAQGVTYIFLGKELGARSDDPGCYESGKVRYDRLAQTELFQHGLNRLQEGMDKGFHIALMCAEKEPLECHRTILVARHLASRGIDVRHIHANGSLEIHADAMRRLTRMVGLETSMDDMFSSPEALQTEAYRRQEDRIAYERERPAATVETPAFRSAGR